MVGQSLIMYEDAKISETHSASIVRAEIILILQSVHIRHYKVASATPDTEDYYSLQQNQTTTISFSARLIS